MTDAIPQPGNLLRAEPFFNVADIQRSLLFYRDDLGFQTTHWWPEDKPISWCRVIRDDVPLMLQQLHPERPLAGPPGLGVAICIMCRDAVAIYREFRTRGVDASRPFVGNGLWVTAVTDPDGYRLEFESPTDAPEESVLED